MLNLFTFTFNGVNSETHGIYATAVDFVTVEKKPKSIEIPFRHGVYTFPQTYYAQRTLRLRCFWLNNKAVNLSRGDLRNVSQWLSGRGRIVLDIEPDLYYIGEVMGAHELLFRRNYSNNRSTSGGFDIDFICEPFGYRDMGIIMLSGNTPIDYQGTAETPTVITTSGSIDTLDAAGQVLQHMEVTGANVTVDSEHYTAAAGGANALNSHSGDWITIDKNVSRITGTGTLQYRERYI